MKGIINLLLKLPSRRKSTMNENGTLKGWIVSLLYCLSLLISFLYAEL